jgi:MFS family permease
MLTRSGNTPSVAPALESLRALDWLNFFLAALLVGFGPFVPVHLAENGWAPASIGLALTVGGLAGLLTQVPAGELIDVVKSKRVLVGAGTAAGSLALLIFALRPDFPSVAAAAVMQGAAGSILGPSVAAVTLALVGHDALGERLGRNQRFASVGGLAAAAIMGAVGYFLSTRDIFLVAAALGIPLLFALAGVRGADIHFGRSCGAPNPHAPEPQRVSRAALFKDHRLLTFTACLFLFQFANASLLPQIGQQLVHVEGRASSLVVSALIVFPQIVVALLAPWVGRTAATWGWRLLLVIGLAAVPIRSGLFALTADPVVLVVVQLLAGLTNGTGRFNLAQGFVGAVSGVGASLSTSIIGIVAQRFGYTAGLLGITALGLMSVAIVLAFMPETKPSTLPQKLGLPSPREAGT